MPGKLTDKEIVKACPYCHKDNEGYVKMFGRFYLRKDHFNGWNLYAGKGKPLPIKFCPICGRPLEIKQTQVYSIQDDFCGVPCKFMEDKINRLQAENEELVGNADKLKAENERLKNAYKQCAWERDIFAEDMKEEIKKDCSYLMLDIKTIKEQAYKEFAERLKEHREIVGYDRDLELDIYGSHIHIDIDEFDNLLKELIGE